MGKYRGSDGWLHDDSVPQPRRYHHRDSTGGPPSRLPPDKCPNCGFASSWRRMEGLCKRCGWGSRKTAMTDKEAGTCCGFLAASVTIPLVGMGAGYGWNGFGGLLVGLGLSVGLIMAFAIYCVVAIDDRPADKAPPKGDG